MHKTSFFLFLLMTALNTHAQSYQKLAEQAEVAFNEYNISQAIELGEKALGKAKKSKGDNSVAFARIYSDLGIYYYFNYQTSLADVHIKTALEIVKNKVGEENDDFIYVLGNAGMLASYKQEYKKAADLNAHLLEIIKTTHGEKNEDYAIALSNYATVLGFLGQYSLAVEKLLSVEKIFKAIQLDEKPEYADLLNNIASSYRDMGKYLLAEDYYMKAEKEYQKHYSKNSYEYATWLRNIGDLYLVTNRNEAARKKFVKARDIFVELLGENSAENANMLSFLGMVAKNNGDFGIAEKNYFNASEIFKNILGTKSAEYIQSLSNLAALQSSLGRYSRANEIYEESLKATWLIDQNPIKYLTIQQNMGLNLIYLYEYEKAKNILESVYRQYKLLIGNEDLNLVFILNNLATAYGWLENNKKELELYQKSKQILEKEGATLTEDYIVTLNNLGVAYLDIKNYRKAEEVILKSLELIKKIRNENHPDYSNTLGLLANTYEKMGDETNAEKYYLKMMKSQARILGNNFMFMSAEEKEKLLWMANLQFTMFYHFSLERSNENPAIINELYYYKTLYKSVILNSVKNLQKNITESKNPMLIAEFERYKNLKEYLNKLYTLPGTDVVSSNEIDSVEKIVNQLEKSLYENNSLMMPENKLKDFTWEKVRKTLGKNEAAIEIIRIPYYGSENKAFEIFYAALIIKPDTREHPELVIFNNGRDMEEALSDDYFYNIFDKKEDLVAYKNFWEPIEDRLMGIEKIYVSVDGIYSLINLNTLKNPVTGKYLIENFDIRLVSNTRDVVDIKNHVNYDFRENTNTVELFGYPNYYLDVTKNLSMVKDEIMALGKVNENRKFERQFQYINPLPGTKKEIELIREVIQPTNWHVNTYLGDDATEQKIKAIKSPTILHLATHGFFDFEIEDEKQYTMGRVLGKVALKGPLHRSGILLAGSGFVLKLVEGDIRQLSNFEDGILSAYEASLLDIDDTEIVILSACLSRVGNVKLTDTESFYGMLRGFLMAGANSVIASCWPVDDFATQELMTVFYKKLVQSNDKYKSFREAQIELLKKYPEPYFWGAFIIVGE